VLATASNYIQISALGRCCLGIASHQLGESENGVQGSAKFVAHVRQKSAFRLICGFRSFFCSCQFFSSFRYPFFQRNACSKAAAFLFLRRPSELRTEHLFPLLRMLTRSPRGERQKQYKQHDHNPLNMFRQVRAWNHAESHQRKGDYSNHEGDCRHHE